MSDLNSTVLRDQEGGGIICKFNQTGFCKYRDKCRHKHNDKACENKTTCNKENCKLRHPKLCRTFRSTGKCRHNENCAYSHAEIELSGKEKEIDQIVAKHDEEIAMINAELEKMKLIIFNMGEETKHLKDELQFRTKTTETIDIGVEVTCEKTVNETVNKCNKDKMKHHLEVMRDKSKDAQESMLNCDKCEYKCKKEITLKKHKHTKHEEQKCKHCNIILKTAMELVLHVAKEHISNIIEEVNESSDLEQDKTIEVNQDNIIEEQQDKM